MFWFAVVGVIGFVVDAGVLLLMVEGLGADPYAGRAASFIAAASATWWLNRSLTFRSRRRKSFREWGFYLVLMAGGAAVNLSLYSLMVWRIGAAPIALIAALMVGTGGGMVVNFVSARYALDR